MMANGISNLHWKFEDYKERISTKEWKKMLLDCEDKIHFEGRVRQLIAKKLGYGVVEISKKPLDSQ